LLAREGKRAQEVDEALYVSAEGAPLETVSIRGEGDKQRDAADKAGFQRSAGHAAIGFEKSGEVDEGIAAAGDGTLQRGWFLAVEGSEIRFRG
jgi:hypothetical protein